MSKGSCCGGGIVDRLLQQVGVKGKKEALKSMSLRAGFCRKGKMGVCLQAEGGRPRERGHIEVQQLGGGSCIEKERGRIDCRKGRL